MTQIELTVTYLARKVFKSNLHIRVRNERLDLGHRSLANVTELVTLTLKKLQQKIENTSRMTLYLKTIRLQVGQRRTFVARYKGDRCRRSVGNTSLDSAVCEQKPRTAQSIAGSCTEE